MQVEGEPHVGVIPEIISKNLQLSGLFKVLSPASFVETEQRCIHHAQEPYSDWSVIGSEGLIRGVVRGLDGRGKKLEVELYLHDVLRRRMVVGKKYTGSVDDVRRIAHRFSNEVVMFFTGEPGIFGTKIAYVGKVGRYKELFVMDLDGSNVRKLTNDRGIIVSPAWSPRGDRLLYTSYRTRRPELYTMSPEGSAPVQITKKPGLEMGAEFMPDSSSIITAASFGGVSNIVLLDSRGNLNRKLTDSSSIDVSPSLSPDGSEIAYCSNRAGGPQVYVMNAMGEERRRVSFVESKYCTSPSWSPNGKFHCFCL